MNQRYSWSPIGRILLVVALGSAACGGGSRPSEATSIAVAPTAPTAPTSTDAGGSSTSGQSSAASITTLPSAAAPPPVFASQISPLVGEPLSQSSWNEDCPVEAEELRYITVSYRDFDGETQTGELIVATEVANDIIQVFARLFEAGYPIFEMRIVTADDIDNPDPLTNNSASFACRVVKDSNVFSQHAYGLAVDINPFFNPYVKGEVVIPAGAGEFVDRTKAHPAVIGPDSVVVEAFSEIGWAWGGNWRSLKDYQHFSLHNR